MRVGDIIILVIASIILVLMCILLFRVNKQFRDRSLEIKEGMNGNEVMEIMEKEPSNIDELKEGKYKWTFIRKDYKGWGYQIITTEVYFDEFNKVTLVERNISYDRPNLKKD